MVEQIHKNTYCFQLFGNSQTAQRTIPNLTIIKKKKNKTESLRQKLIFTNKTKLNKALNISESAAGFLKE